MSGSTVELEDWLAPLVPRFLENRTRDARELAATVAAGDFGGLRFLAHKLHGAAAGYGFPVIAEIGLRLEAAADARDAPAAAALVDELARHLATVKVVYRPSGR